MYDMCYLLIFSDFDSFLDASVYYIYSFLRQKLDSV